MRFITYTFLIFLGGCSSSLLFIDKEYLIRPETKVTFIPVSHDVFKGYNPKEVEKAFKSDNRGASKILVDNLNSVINKVLADSLVEVEFIGPSMWNSLQISVFDDKYLRDFICKIGDDSVVMALRIPREDVFDTLNLATSVYFVITSVDFSNNRSKRCGPWTSAKVRYAIWDNHIHRAIVYGEIEANQASVFEVGSNSWNNLFTIIAPLLISNSPFNKGSIVEFMK